MLKKEVIIELSEGMAARNVAMLVQIAGQYPCSVNVGYNERTINAKSIMGMMSLGAANGETLAVITDGEQEEEALNRLVDFISGKEK